MAVSAPAAGTKALGWSGAAEPSGRAFELGGYAVERSDGKAKSRRAVTLPVSIALHTLGALALVAVPLLLSDEVPEAHADVRAFLVEPMAIAPPPPPPAARPAAPPRVAPKLEPRQQAFVAPVEVPTEITPEQALDLGSDEAGAAGGVDGGVPGGVVGGIVGGLPEAPPPVAAPIRVGGSIREPKRLVVVPPVYPELAMKARVQGMVIVEATLNERGRVVNVSLVQGLPLLSDAALDAVRKWVYTPTLVNGVPVPVIMTVKVHFRLNDSLG
jgi:protein TonB